MANDFSKEERVAFESLLEGFQDALVLSKAVNLYGTDGTLMERTNDTIWRPQPYIAQSQDRIVGSSVTANNMTQLSVPSTLGYKKNSTWTMDSLELRDALQENRLGDAAKQKLATDINLAVLSVATLQGTLVETVTTASGTFDNVALCDSVMNEQGVAMDQRYIAFNSRDYNGLANNLQIASRSFGNSKSNNAYERAVIGNDVAGFTALKMDNGRRITAALGSAATTTSTLGTQAYVPVATRTAATGETGNVDNRYQTITVNSTTNIAAGDAYTIDGVEAVHHITKQSTGRLKTFRVISVDSATTMTVSPPMITAQGGTDAELQYQNCVVTAPSGTNDIDWLNTTATGYNVFWRKPAIELLPGRYAVPSDQGVAVMRGATDQGVEIVMAKKFDNATFKSFYTLDVLFGVVMTDPEQCGVLLFGQT